MNNKKLMILLTCLQLATVPFVSAMKLADDKTADSANPEQVTVSLVGGDGGHVVETAHTSSRRLAIVTPIVSGDSRDDAAASGGDDGSAGKGSGDGSPSEEVVNQELQFAGAAVAENAKMHVGIASLATEWLNDSEAIHAVGAEIRGRVTAKRKALLARTQSESVDFGGKKQAEESSDGVLKKSYATLAAAGVKNTSGAEDEEETVGDAASSASGDQNDFADLDLDEASVALVITINAATSTLIGSVLVDIDQLNCALFSAENLALIEKILSDEEQDPVTKQFCGLALNKYFTQLIGMKKEALLQTVDVTQPNAIEDFVEALSAWWISTVAEALKDHTNLTENVLRLFTNIDGLLSAQCLELDLRKKIGDSRKRLVELENKSEELVESNKLVVLAKDQLARLVKRGGTKVRRIELQTGMADSTVTTAQQERVRALQLLETRKSNVGGVDALNSDAQAKLAAALNAAKKPDGDDLA